MRVLHVSTDMARNPHTVAGNTACLRRLLSELGRRVELTVWSTRQAARPGTLWAAMRKMLYLTQWMLRPLHRYDVVIALTPYAMSAMLLPCRLWRKPLIYDIDDNILPDLERFPLLPRLESLNRHRASAIRAISRHLVAYLKDEGIATDTYYIPHGIDLRAVSASGSPRPPALANSVLLGYAGGFQSYQGVENLIDMMGLLGDTAPPVTLVLIGVDEHDPSHHLIRTKLSGTTNIRAYPRQTPADTLSLLSMCDVLALPRPNVPIAVTAAPTKFVEYCALGKPVLTTDVGDAADWVRRSRCGQVAADNQPRTMANALITLLGDDLITVGRNARALAESEFSIARIADDYVSMLREVVSLYRSKGSEPPAR
jgi:glycosyltransferase involved in cell wall biosynthesis